MEAMTDHPFSNKLAKALSRRMTTKNMQFAIPASCIIYPTAYSTGSLTPNLA